MVLEQVLTWTISNNYMHKCYQAPMMHLSLFDVNFVHHLPSLKSHLYSIVRTSWKIIHVLYWQKITNSTGVEGKIKKHETILLTIKIFVCSRHVTLTIIEKVTGPRMIQNCHVFKLDSQHLRKKQYNRYIVWDEFELMMKTLLLTVRCRTYSSLLTMVLLWVPEVLWLTRQLTIIVMKVTFLIMNYRYFVSSFFSFSRFVCFPLSPSRHFHILIRFASDSRHLYLPQPAITYFVICVLSLKMYMKTKLCKYIPSIKIQL